MKIKQSNKMRPSISKAILFFGCLFAVINLYGQESALSFGSEPAQSAEGPFILKSESNVQAKAQPAAQPASNDVAQADPAVYCKNELSIWGAGGLSTLFYDPSFGDLSLGLGGGFGLGYTFYFSKNFGILAGAELAFYNAKMKVDGLTDMYRVENKEKDHVGVQNVDYYSEFSNYEEKQRMTNVNIPIALQYQTNGKHKFFASLGFKLGIPVSGKYEVSDGSTFKTYGYYERWNQYIYNVPYLGYGTFEGDGSKKDIDFGLSYMGTFEAGAKWRLSRVLSLYTGLYFEYGFNDVVDGHNDRFLAYNSANPENFTVNSTLTSQYTEDGKKPQSFTDHVSPMAAGLKLRLGVNLCKKAKDAEEARVPAPAPTPTPVKRPQPKPVVIEDEMDEPVQRGVKRLSDEEMEEDLRRAVSEYGSSVKGTVGIELEGYELDQSVLSPRMERILDDKVAQIRKMYGSDISIICEGHTCDVGNEAYNMRLGQKRADIVRNFLISRGFNANKVVAISKGQSSPIVPNTDEANRKKNRRVVLIIRD